VKEFTVFELLWIKVYCGTRDVIIGALYHTPKPSYTTKLTKYDRIDAGRDATSDARKIYVAVHTGDVIACHCFAKALKKKEEECQCTLVGKNIG